MKNMERELYYFVLGDALSCWRLFGKKSLLVMKRTSCHIVAANFVAEKCGVVLPDQVEVISFDMLQMDKVYALQKRFAPGLSLSDAASLFIAKYENVTLIADDGLLRRCAAGMQIKTIDCKTFAAHVAQLEAEGAPPLRLADYRMKKIEQKENNYENHKPIDNKR